MAKANIASFDIANSGDTMNLAVDLAKFIKENKLYQNVQGKDYVNVEGWQYAGSRLGIVPILGEVESTGDSTEIKYIARITLFDMKSNQAVGGGVAICSNKEQGRKYYQEYAIASMAQTRAIGKAYRNLLAWIIRAAGYEPTPAEEMDYQGNEPSKSETYIPKSLQPASTQKEPPQAVEAPVEQPLQQPAPADEAPVKYASAKQKEEIILLLNNPVISRQQKTQGLLGINKLDEEQAKRFIGKLNKIIKEGENDNHPAA